MSIFLSEELMKEPRILRKTQPVSSPESRALSAFPRRARRHASLAAASALAQTQRSFACDVAVRLAAAQYELPRAEVAARRRGSRRASRARHVAIYLAHVSLGLPLGAVAEEIGRDRSTAAYACRVVEDARDDPAFDAALAGLEMTAGVLIELGHTPVTK
jgi:hypothetical protein